MSLPNNDPLKSLLQLHRFQPTRVIVELVDGAQRELRPDKDTRKRWVPILKPLHQMEWVRVELFRGDTTLAIIPNPEMEAVEVPATATASGCCPACGRPQGGDDLDRILRAQTIALTWQDKQVQTALNANVQTVVQLNTAIGALTRVQALQLEAAQAAPAAAPAGDEDPDDLSRLYHLATKVLGDGGGVDGLTPERVKKLGAFLDTLPTPTPAKPKLAAPKPSTPAPTNGAAH